MRKERAPEMRLYEWDILRWLTSRTRAELDPTGRYIYRELLDLCYAQGKISRDHETLARHAGVSLEDFEHWWPRMARHFHVSKHDSESLVNDFATVARRNYFKFCAMQAKKRKNRGSGNPMPESEIQNNGRTTVQPLINQEEIRREEIRREEKKRENNTPNPQTTAPDGQDYGARYRALYDRHVIPGFQQDGEYEYQRIISEAVNPERTAELIDTSHPEWMAYFRDHPDVYRPGIGKWLKDGYYTRKPPETKSGPAPGGCPLCGESRLNKAGCCVGCGRTRRQAQERAIERDRKTAAGGEQ